VDVTEEATAQFTSPFDELYGLRVISASAERVTAEVALEPKHMQPYGIVHGGVYASMIEATCSIGGSVWAVSNDVGLGAMGVSNHTDFLRSTGAGSLTVIATRVQSGGTLQLWQADVLDDTGRPLAHGVVRLMNVKGQVG
jgi:1,4-dihydroxy-2-naphthoyl-CoA hydrolase